MCSYKIFIRQLFLWLTPVHLNVCTELYIYIRLAWQWVLPTLPLMYKLMYKTCLLTESVIHIKTVDIAYVSLRLVQAISVEIISQPHHLMYQITCNSLICKRLYSLHVNGEKKMNKTQSKNFVSVVLLSFPSQAQYDLWYEKYITFYNSKAVEFLKKNGQLSQSANLVNDDNDLFTFLILHIRTKMLMRPVKKFHGQWAKIGAILLEKCLAIVGEQIWGFD